MSSTSWSEAEVSRMLRENDFAYQKIALPYGLSTPGRDRSATADRIFPADLRGKTVLDVGSFSGFFCFEALKRGASRAVGIDIDPERIRKARLLASCLGLDATFRLQDVETDEIEESFDYVLCLNVLHHLRDPLATLDRLIARTRERLILEIATVGAHDRKKLGLSALAAFVLRRAPVMVVNPRRGRDLQTFFITSSALRHLLLDHRRAFARMETLRSDHKDRYIAVAHKRRIDRLVVVAGPTGSGKSTLIARLTGGALPVLAEKITEGGSSWTVTSVGQLPRLTEPHIENLILHYDFLWQFPSSASFDSRDEALALIDAARYVTFVTIWCLPEVLQRRHAESEIAAKSKDGRSVKKRQLRIQDEYRHPARIAHHYRNWLEYAQGKPGEHLIVSADGDTLRFHSLEDWEAVAQRYETEADSELGPKQRDEDRDLSGRGFSPGKAAS